ncbi:MAG TPA: VOC family protein, partial [Thermoanaerobaculia bacterium]|nr:VOC family protein [Thermoanaerobaculia bacterium]
MLSDKNAAVTIAVKDTKAAKKFYEGVLGLKPIPSRELGVLNYKSGDSSILVYESRYAGTNKATAATWVVDDVERAVDDLKHKGVKFEHYDMPEMTLKGDIHVAGHTHA